jgi:hypothetical protein
MNKYKKIKLLGISGFILLVLWLVFCLLVGAGSSSHPKSSDYLFLVKFSAYYLVCTITFTIIYIGAIVNWTVDWLRKNKKLKNEISDTENK